MKNIILYSILFTSFLFSNTTCAEKLTGEDGIDKRFMKDIIKIEINNIENTNHYISSISSISNTGLKFLNFNTINCTEGEKRKLKFYQAIVELFGLSKRNFIIPKKIADNNHAEKDKLFGSLKDTQTFTPIIHGNKKYTKDNIQNILAYHKIDIQDVDIYDLQEKISNIKFDANETIGTIEKKLSIMIENNLKEYKENNSLADSLFAIAENKLLYQNHSWLAMNFYDTVDIKMIDQFKSIPIVRSDLITSDMDNKSYVYYMPKNNDKNDSSKYHYFLAKDGNINPISEMEATLHYFFDDKDTTIRKKRICQYENRYILLKQLFKKFKVNKFPKDFSCNLNITEIEKYKYNFVYVTSGEEGSESYGHTMLNVYRGERTSENKVENMPDDFTPDIHKATYNRKINISKDKSQNIKKDSNNSEIVSDEIYINFGVPEEKSSGFFNSIKGFFGGIYGVFTFHEESTFLPNNYNNRMIIKIPITALDKDPEKKLLLEAHLRHIQKHTQGQNSSNDILFKFPYKFISKNCAYIMSDLIEVPLPHLREKFNNESFFSFTPQDMFKLLEGEINVNQHQTSNP